MTEARVRFLNAGARLYAMASPSLSTNLMSHIHEHPELTEYQNRLKTAVRVCKSCSSLQLPGYNSYVVSTTTIEKRMKPTPTGGARKAQTSRVHYRCSVCNRFTPHAIEKAQGIRRAVHTNTGPTPASSTSRQALRKKRRKAGLEGLLAEAPKSSNNTTASFTLADLMQKPPQ